MPIRCGASGNSSLGLASGRDALDQAIRTVGTSYPWHLTFLADLLANRLESVSPESRDLVAHAAKLHPERWRTALRETLALEHGPLTLQRLGCSRRSAITPTSLDFDAWQKLAGGQARRRTSGVHSPGGWRFRSTSRIRARVSITVGEREIAGTSVRRKVLALLCFLVTKPEMSATRDQVLDALWPELDPEIAINSLNQTLYFLRRVFEEQYSEDLSPGYVHHDSDVIWLDPELVTAGAWNADDWSATCRRDPAPTTSSASRSCIAGDSPSISSTRSGPARIATRSTLPTWKSSNDRFSTTSRRATTTVEFASPDAR